MRGLPPSRTSKRSVPSTTIVGVAVDSVGISNDSTDSVTVSVAPASTTNSDSLSARKYQPSSEPVCPAGSTSRPPSSRLMLPDDAEAPVVRSPPPAVTVPPRSTPLAQVIRPPTSSVDPTASVEVDWLNWSPPVTVSAASSVSAPRNAANWSPATVVGAVSRTAASVWVMRTESVAAGTRSRSQLSAVSHRPSPPSPVQAMGVCACAMGISRTRTRRRSGMWGQG